MRPNKEVPTASDATELLEPETLTEQDQSTLRPPTKCALPRNFDYGTPTAQEIDAFLRQNLNVSLDEARARHPGQERIRVLIAELEADVENPHRFEAGDLPRN